MMPALRNVACISLAAAAWCVTFTGMATAFPLQAPHVAGGVPSCSSSSSLSFSSEPSSHQPSTRLYNAGTTKQQPKFPMPKSLSYGEESRTYRRTIYTHDDWIKHRAPNRYFLRARTTFRSGVYANILLPVLSVVGVAAFTIVWNALAVQYVDFRGVTHPGLLASTFVPELRLPMAPFTLTSASLGLLLVFRTNTGYGRWDEARKNWGMNINRTRDLFRMAAAWYDDVGAGVTEQQRQKDLTTLSLATWAFVRSMKRHLSPDNDEAGFRKELFHKLPDSQAESILNAKHRPNRALFDLSCAIENLPMHFLRKNQLHAALTKFEDNLGSSERILASPVPLFYSRHTARFLFFWMLGLPLALYNSFKSWNHIMLIPMCAFISTFMFGIEELANQLEEPFTILPQQAFCDKIYQWCTEMVSWRPGDNGVAVNHYAKSCDFAPTSSTNTAMTASEQELF